MKPTGLARWYLSARGPIKIKLAVILVQVAELALYSVLMTPLTALLIATPIFGFQLTVDSAYMPGAAETGSYTLMASAQVEGVAEASEDAEADASDEATVPSASEAVSRAEIQAAMQTRARLTPIHRWMGIATWTSMTATVVLGWLQYANLYGFFSSRENTRCVRGNAFFGQTACVDTPWPHLASSILTAALYTSTFSLALRMPDPMNFDEGDGEYARNLRRHKRLRWVHFAGMIAQMGLGIVIANSETFGLDRANNYGALQALSTIHLGIGLVTYATLTWSGLIFLFN